MGDQHSHRKFLVSRALEGALDDDSDENATLSVGCRSPLVMASAVGNAAAALALRGFPGHRFGFTGGSASGGPSTGSPTTEEPVAASGLSLSPDEDAPRL